SRWWWTNERPEAFYGSEITSPRIAARHYRELGIALVLQSRLHHPPARRPEAARLHQETPVPRWHLPGGNRTHGQQGQGQYSYRATRNRDRQKGCRDRQAESRHSENDEGQGSLHQHSRGAPSGSRSAAGGREYRVAAGAPGRLSPCDEGSGDTC